MLIGVALQVFWSLAVWAFVFFSARAGYRDVWMEWVLLRGMLVGLPTMTFVNFFERLLTSPKSALMHSHMETTILANPLPPKSDKSLYTKRWIWIGSFLGGPLAGCYLLSKNFAALGRNESARKSLWIGVIATLMLFGSLVFIPQSIMDAIPRSLIPIIYTVIIYQYAARLQGKDIEEHVKNGGKKQSGWKALGIAVLALILSLLYFFLLALAVIFITKIGGRSDG